jgi:hypothetical protein
MYQPARVAQVFEDEEGNPIARFSELKRGRLDVDFGLF